MAGVAELVRIPYAPRPLQRVIHAALDAHRFAAVVCHRRFGKTVLAVNHLIKSAMRCDKPRPRFAYIAPTYRQGKSIAWDYLKHFSNVVEGRGVNESELRIDFPDNEAQVRIYGADNPDALRGIYLDGVVLDEYALMDGSVWSQVIRPLLADRRGWALFIGTPNGRNQFYTLIHGDGEWVGAKRNPDWFYAEYKASETGYVDAGELAQAREVMTDDEYAQEFECSFEASVRGAVYAREVAAARESGRVTRVPWDPGLQVDTDWDLGIDDSTAIWFSQTLGSGEVRLIDYYEATGHGLEHYAKVLKEKPYAYGSHVAPHDIEVRELTSGRSRLELARGLGIFFSVGPRVQNIADRIYAARSLFPLCWFDAEKCAKGLDALQNYRWKEQGTDATGNKLPVHDWASHCADAFGGLAYRSPRSVRKSETLTKAALARAQRDDDPFRWGSQRAQGRGGYA
jgi:phage terminase large subunit